MTIDENSSCPFCAAKLTTSCASLPGLSCPNEKQHEAEGAVWGYYVSDAGDKLLSFNVMCGEYQLCWHFSTNQTSMWKHPEMRMTHRFDYLLPLNLTDPSIKRLPIRIKERLLAFL